MTPLNKVLLGALALQGALVAVAWWPREEGPPEARDLLGVATDDIASITIWGRMAVDEVPEAPVVLSRGEGGWAIDSADGYPATDANVEPLLELLGGLKATEAVASRAESWPALEVADDRFTRKVLVRSRDGAERTLLIGAGTGKEVHVRVQGETEAWRVRGLSAWAIQEHANRYFDRDFLKVDPATVTTVSLERPGQPPFAFLRAEDGTWTVTSGAPPDLELDPKRVGDYVTTLLTLRMLEPAGREARPEMALGSSAAVSWVGVDGARAGYRIGSPVTGETGRYWLQSDHSPFVVKVLEGTVDAALSPDPGSWRVGARSPGLLDDLPGGGAPRGRPH